MKKPTIKKTGAQSPNDPKLSDCRSTAQPVRGRRRLWWLRRWVAQAVTCVGSSLQRMVRRRSDASLDRESGRLFLWLDNGRGGTSYREVKLERLQAIKSMIADAEEGKTGNEYLDLLG